MSIVVPFDGSELATAALERASALGSAFDGEVHAVTVIPEGVEYALDRGWIDDGAAFDPEAVAGQLRRQVAGLDPDIAYHATHVGSRLPQGAIAKRLRRQACDLDADLVVIGSDNAGGIVTPISSVGASVATDHEYDVYVVRQREDYLRRRR